jgi:hypothetical protein
MTRDDIIKMAREAGIDVWWDSGNEHREGLQEHLERRIRDLASRAIRLSAEDGKITGFGHHEKTIMDNIDFLYWLVNLAEMDEREACAKVAENWLIGHTIAYAIRTRGEK